MSLPSYSTLRVVRGILLLCAGVVMGVSGSVFLSSDNPKETIFSSSSVRDGLPRSSFTNPLLECAELPESISIGERKGLEAEINGLIDRYKSEGKATQVAVYFRDLNNGPWFGINETERFYPASLLKVPLAMSYYFFAQTNPDILTQEIAFKGPRGTTIAYFPPTKHIEEGNTYTIEELILLMLEQSDNDAAVILDQFAGRERTGEVYRDLGVDPGTVDAIYSIDVRTYASFFRILYNATYIGRVFSERMLETMSRSSFEQGIVAGVPSNIRVAQKFGEKILAPDSTGKPLYQLHNCGIVYAEIPYTLCIMTQGYALEELADIIKNTSATVFAAVHN